MSIKEFSDEFDTLLNSYNLTGDFGEVANKLSINLDEYEKSVFLTNAQEELIIELYNGKNSFGDSFERTEEVRRYISELVKTYETNEKLTDYLGISKNSIFFKIPKDTWFITYESAILQDDRLGCSNGGEILVVPVTQDDFYKVQENPFRGSNKRRALRLDIKGSVIELVSEYNVDKYLIRYIARPNPIILINLPDGLSINGVSAETECELNPVIHRVILERAVKLALASRTPISR